MTGGTALVERTRPARPAPERRTVGAAAVLVPLISTTVLWAVFVQLRVTSAIVVALISSFLVVRQIVLTVTQPHGGPVALVFWTFLLGWMCVGSLAQMGQGRLPWPDSGLDDLYPWGQLLFLGAILSYLAGTRLGSGRRRPEDADRPPAAGAPRGRLAALILCAILLAFFVVSTTGGLPARFTTRDEAGAAVGEALGEIGASGDTVRLFLLNRLPVAIVAVVGYASADALVRARRSRSAGAAVAALRMLVCFALLVILANPWSTPRYLVFSAAGAVVLGLVPLRNVHRRAVAAVVLVLGTVVLYPLATWFKKSATQTSRSVDLSTFTGIDFDGFQTTMTALAHVRDFGYAHGEHILAAVAFFVPRSLWSSKPTPANLDIAADRGYSFLNLSLPLWAELYLDATVVGMVLGMGALGYVSRTLDIAYDRQEGGLAPHLAVLVATAQVGLLRGPLGGSVVFFGTVVLIGWFAFARRGRAPALAGDLRQDVT